MKFLKILRNLLLIISVLVVGILAFYFRFDIPVETLKAKYANKDSKFIEIDQMPVHYRLEGEGKETLVLIHGTGASLHTWERWTEILKKDFQILRMDLPAFGLTGPHPQHQYSIQDYVSFIDKLLIQLNISQCHLAGNSLGGQIAWEYTLARPERVNKLILIDAGGVPSDRKRPWIFQLAQTPVLNQIVRYVTPRFFFENNLKQVYADHSKITEELITRYYELARREGNREAFIERTKTSSKSNFGTISKIKNLTLIQWGEADTWIPLSSGKQLEDKLPNAKLIVYPKVGHVPMEEAPEITVKDALRFLKEKNDNLNLN